MPFDFATAGRILFGTGRLKEIGAIAGAYGRRALLITGAQGGRAEGIRRHLGDAGIASTELSIGREPTTDDLRRGIELAQAADCDVVIGFGGGSPMDAAKGVAALLGNGGEPLDYLEVIGRGLALTKPSLPCIAIPTTAGTGTEVTRNAVILSPEHGVKVSLRGMQLLPSIALVDPELSASMPPAVTASTGLDALTQLIEPFVSSRANPLTDALCREGMRRIARSLHRAYEHGDDMSARLDMALAALFSGMALANAGLGSVHGFAGVIGGMVRGPHGAVCAALLPHAMRVNLRAFLERAPESEALQRYAELGRLLTGGNAAGAAEAVAWIEDTCAALRVPPLETYGLRPDHLPQIIEKSAAASSMRANPIALTRDEMHEIVIAALGGLPDRPRSSDAA
jgi:alcohol dehydrogenase class IV